MPLLFQISLVTHLMHTARFYNLFIIVSLGAAQAHSCSSTPPPAFDEISDYGNSVQRQSDENSERRFSSGYGTRGSNYRDDTIR
jgi:hypothetical protein